MKREDQIKFLRRVLFLSFLLLPAFSFLVPPGTHGYSSFGARFIFGAYSGVLLAASFIFPWVEQRLNSLVYLLIFLAIPYMTRVLNETGFHPVWVLFTLITFFGMASVIFEIRVYWAFLIWFCGFFLISLLTALNTQIDFYPLIFLTLSMVLIHVILVRGILDHFAFNKKNRASD